MSRTSVHDAAWPGAQISDSRFRISFPASPPRQLPDGGGLQAGVAEVDITPPPGMPKAGHSKNAQDGDGFRTRLKARVVHLRSGTGSVALIALDLLAGSSVLQHGLAAAVADLDLDLDGIFLAATHTHAGPGQYSGSAFYNDWASNRPGFDPGYAGFLLRQLETAVREAVGSRRPARAAIGTTDVWGLTRNRSLGAFVRNDGLEDQRLEDQRKYAAIDPRLHLLRVDDQQGPLGAFSWFSIHGTGISHHDPAYNADVWAYLNGELVHRVRAATGADLVSGAVVASHGDMTPAVKPGMLVYEEAERIGRGIGASAAALHADLGARLDDQFPVASHYRQLDTTAKPVIDGISLESPRIGWAKTAGAAENTTPVLHLVPPFKAGHGHRRPRGPHAEKRIAATERGHGRFVGRPDDFPTVIGIHVLRLGDVGVIGLPFETTVEAGRRIAAEVLATNTGLRCAFVSSLVDDQTDYLTTREEYAAQYYEGASVLFGPRQQAWVAAQAREAARDLLAGRASVALQRDFSFGVHRYLAEPTGTTLARVFGTPRYVEGTPVEAAYWEQTWTDVAPGDLSWHEPLLRIEIDEGEGWKPATDDDRPLDDQGWRLAISYLGQRRGRHRYRGRWYCPSLGRPVRHRFVLLANASQPGAAGPAFD